MLQGGHVDGVHVHLRGKAAPVSSDSRSDRRESHLEGFDTGDDLVQHLAVAKYALTVGDTERAMASIDAALALSRASLDQLVTAPGADAGRSFAGRLVRNNPAPAPRRRPSG